MQGGGAIVNTASILGVLALPGSATYATSKFAVVGLTKLAAVEVGALGVRVNCVCPTTSTPHAVDVPRRPPGGADARKHRGSRGRGSADPLPRPVSCRRRRVDHHEGTPPVERHRDDAAARVAVADELDAGLPSDVADEQQTPHAGERRWSATTSP
jgi:NAD(P)-dependent dehydrogenase (short-subunit alcohol dehydrogenase family)